jgi:hypothetical protein
MAPSHTTGNRTIHYKQQNKPSATHSMTGFMLVVPYAAGGSQALRVAVGEEEFDVGGGHWELALD